MLFKSIPIYFAILVLALEPLAFADDEPVPEQAAPPAEPAPAEPVPAEPVPVETAPAATAAPEITQVPSSTPAPIAVAEVTSFMYEDSRIKIDRSLSGIATKIVEWQADMFDFVVTTLTPIQGRSNELKRWARDTILNQESSLLQQNAVHTKTLFQQQVTLLREAIETGQSIEQDLVKEEADIMAWCNNVTQGRDNDAWRALLVRDHLRTMVSDARNKMKETKSSIMKIFSNHYYTIDNDRLNVNGAIDTATMQIKSETNRFITQIKVTNNTLFNKLSQESAGHQETIDLAVSELRKQLDSWTGISGLDRDKIVNHLEERSVQLDESLFNAFSENQVALNDFIDTLLRDTQSTTYDFENSMNNLKNRFDQLTTINKERADRLSIATYKTLEPVESLLSSRSKKLQRDIDSVKIV